MGEGNDYDLERHKADLRRQDQNWQARFTLWVESDRSAVGIGLVVLRTVILMNAGALVALLAFVGQLWVEDQGTMTVVLRRLVPFVYGVVTAALAAGVAYFYQSFVTVERRRHLEKLSKVPQEHPDLVWVPRFRNVTRFLMVGLVTVSYGLFVWGVIDVTRTLAP